ncbi:MAG: oligosaccharide flippase family protein [Acidobacteriaceae bacterium]|nr:oligosaccharide flippase family protein [Acidobacteriaceae bacterium]
MKNQSHLLYDIASIYGVQFANYLIPLVTLPYLTRVLGPSTWGLIAMAQAFGMYGSLVVEYGFVFSATRQLAIASTSSEIQDVVAGVSGAKILLGSVIVIAAFGAYLVVPLFHQHPLLLWAAVASEIAKALLPSYYFYGIHRVAVASILDISARMAAAIGIFIFVHRPADAWRFFALQLAGASLALVVGHAMIHVRHRLRWPRLNDGLKMLREGGPMFLFRSAHNIYVLGNAFILGLFASPQSVGYYAGAEKINSAAVGLLSPLTTALYPRAAGLIKNSLHKAARLTTVSFYIMGAISLILGLIMWFGSSLIVHIILGHNFQESVGVLRILSLRSPLVAWTNVLGFQWLLALGLEKPFQKVTVVALILNILLATCFAPAFAYTGMAWAVVISQAAAAIGIYIVLRRRALNPFVIAAEGSRA